MAQVDETLNWNIKCKCIIANVNFEGLSNHSAQVDEYEYELNLREETKTNIKTL